MFNQLVRATFSGFGHRLAFRVVGCRSWQTQAARKPSTPNLVFAFKLQGKETTTATNTREILRLPHLLVFVLFVLFVLILSLFDRDGEVRHLVRIHIGI